MATYPPQNKVFLGEVYGPNDNDYTGNMTLPGEGDVRDAVSYGDPTAQLTGNMTLPPIAKVINSESYGTGGTELTGTYAEPDIEYVVAEKWNGSAWISHDYGAASALTGNFTLPSHTTTFDVNDRVLNTYPGGWGPGGGWTGNYYEPLVDEVLSSGFFGPNGATSGNWYPPDNDFVCSMTGSQETVGTAHMYGVGQATQGNFKIPYHVNGSNEIIMTSMMMLAYTVNEYGQVSWPAMAWGPMSNGVGQWGGQFHWIHVENNSIAPDPTAHKPSNHQGPHNGTSWYRTDLFPEGTGLIVSSWDNVLVGDGSGTYVTPDQNYVVSEYWDGYNWVAHNYGPSSSVPGLFTLPDHSYAFDVNDRVLNPDTWGPNSGWTGNWYPPDNNGVLSTESYGVGDGTFGNWYPPDNSKVGDNETYGVGDASITGTGAVASSWDSVLYGDGSGTYVEPVQDYVCSQRHSGGWYSHTYGANGGTQGNFVIPHIIDGGGAATPMASVVLEKTYNHQTSQWVNLNWGPSSSWGPSTYPNQHGFRIPALGDLESGVTMGTPDEEYTDSPFDYASLTGTLVLPTEAQVEDTVQFGADGTEFTGTLVANESTILTIF